MSAAQWLIMLAYAAGVLGAGGIGFYIGWRIRTPRLTGYPQAVDFQGTPMRIVQMETGAGDWRQRTVTLTLVDEAGWREEAKR